MSDQKIYISKAELKYVLDFMAKEGADYVSLDWENGQIWHKLWVTVMPYGEKHRVPEQEEDLDNH